MKRCQKTAFLGPISSKITLTKKEERTKRKSEKEERRRSKRKRAIVALLAFIVVTLEIVFGRKKLFDTKGPFAGTVFKNPARIFCKMSSIDAK